MDRAARRSATSWGIEALRARYVVPPFSVEDLARVTRLKQLITEWTATGALPPEVATLADPCVTALWGGASWRDLMDNPR